MAIALSNLRRQRSLALKALLVGTLSVLSSSAILTWFAASGISNLRAEAATEIDVQVREQIDNFNLGSYELVSGQAEAVQEQVDRSLTVANDVLDRAGHVRLGTDTVSWDATNQFTLETEQVELPQLEVGGIWLGDNASFDSPSKLVDDITNVVGGTATIFQRMNDEGDMLRVSTNVATLEEERAIGTFIPATNPDGTPNDVLSTVLTGETYSGTAFVVNAWYVTAYQPIMIDGEVAAVMYVGVRQDGAGGLVEKLTSSTLGEHGTNFVLGATGSRAGTFEIAPPDVDLSTPAASFLDDTGQSYLNTIAVDAVAAGGGQVSLEYTKDGVDHIAVASYFEPWDWVIVTDVDVSDFAAASQKIEAYGNEMVRRLVTVSIIATIIIAVGSSAYVHFNVAKPLERATTQMLGSVESIQRLSTDLGASSAEGARRLDEVLGRASEVAEHSESQSHLVETLTEALGETLGESSRSRSVGSEAAARVDEGFEALARLRETSEDIESVVELIDTVASQTKLLSLNATIEAARAGELGKGFGVVATEVKNLAAETELATEKISQRIVAMTNHSTQVRETIDGIRLAVEGLIEVQDSIGMSIDNQRYTMEEIEQRALDTRSATDQVVDATNDAIATATANTSRASASTEASNELRAIVNMLEKLTKGHSA